MARFIIGDIVVVPFPFSNLSNSKRRPALVLSNLNGDDVILCQITSQSKKDFYAVGLQKEDFDNGSLNKISQIRPNRIFTADKNIILYKIGNLKKQKFNDVVENIYEIIRKK